VRLGSAARILRFLPDRRGRPRVEIPGRHRELGLSYASVGPREASALPLSYAPWTAHSIGVGRCRRRGQQHRRRRCCPFGALAGLRFQSTLGRRRQVFLRQTHGLPGVGISVVAFETHSRQHRTVCRVRACLDRPTLLTRSSRLSRLHADSKPSHRQTSSLAEARHS